MQLLLSMWTLMCVVVCKSCQARQTDGHCGRLSFTHGHASLPGPHLQSDTTNHQLSLLVCLDVCLRTSRRLACSWSFTRVSIISTPPHNWCSRNESLSHNLPSKGHQATAYDQLCTGHLIVQNYINRPRPLHGWAGENKWYKFSMPIIIIYFTYRSHLITTLYTLTSIMGVLYM